MLGNADVMVNKCGIMTNVKFLEKKRLVLFRLLFVVLILVERISFCFYLGAYLLMNLLVSLSIAYYLLQLLASFSFTYICMVSSVLPIIVVLILVGSIGFYYYFCMYLRV